MRAPILDLKDIRALRGEHPGLVLHRYLCENATGEGGKPEERQAILRAAIKAAGNQAVRALYTIAYERWRQLLSTTLTVARELQTV
ncbi:MAG: hypothetical protein SNJ62_10180, partial [Chloracidobacterium sp.]